jgi:cystathionine beta-lyase/cystathionine gamma-synthase
MREAQRTSLGSAILDPGLGTIIAVALLGAPLALASWDAISSVSPACSWGGAASRAAAAALSSVAKVLEKTSL